MSHKDVLSLLFPLKLGGVFDQDIAIEGAYLDACEARAGDLLNEMFADTVDETLSDWERVCGLTPSASDTLQMRRNAIIAKLREHGSLSLPHYSALIALMGYTFSIEELRAGTDGTGAEGIFRWRVTFENMPFYWFRVGQSRAGERLVDGVLPTAMEGLLTELKPAHTQIIFAYT